MKDKDVEKEICSYMEKKLHMFNRYLSITRHMKKNFDPKKGDSLDLLLRERKHCMDHIESIDASIHKIARTGPDGFFDFFGQPNGLMESYLKNLKGVMETIDIMDRDLMVSVREEAEDIQGELLKMRTFQQAARGYKMGKRHLPRFLDTRR